MRSIFSYIFCYKYKYSHWDNVQARVHYLNASLISALLHGDMANRLNLIWYRVMKKMLLLFEILCTHEGISCSASRIIATINISMDFLPFPLLHSAWSLVILEWRQEFSHNLLNIYLHISCKLTVLACNYT